MEEEIKMLVKKLFDAGMTIDQIIEKITDIVIEEDLKRFKNETR